MDINSYEPALDARRFEEGTPPIPSVYAAVAGLKLLLDIGLENVWMQNQSLHQALRQGFEGLDLDIKTPFNTGSHGVMIAIAANDEGRAVAALEEAGVIVSSRGGNVRISPHFYNDEADIARLLETLTVQRNFYD
jgi:selenocysteine lyase/cysteine desulfurase